jgi:hypothetical protein
VGKYPWRIGNRIRNFRKEKMSRILALKLVSGFLILTLMFIVGYLNFTITWGLEIKSWLGFFGFFIIITILQALLTSINAIEEE